MTGNNEYVQLITDIKNHIVESRYVATKLVNQELLKLYFRIGMILHQKITNHQWGAKVLERLAADLKIQLPTLRGFSHRNLKNMRQFYTAYSPAPIGQLITAQFQIIDNQFYSVKNSASGKLQEEIDSIGQFATAQLSTSELNAFFGISFTHHLLLLNKCRDIDERLFYMRNAASTFWSVSVLEHYIQERLYQRQGKIPQNFSQTLSKEINDKATQLFKDEYLFDFLNLTAEDDERKIEDEIVSNIRNFILRMGKGFAFIGNQFRIEVGGQEFFIDLLFYNRILQCLVAFELKKGDFKPEYTGQLNFYLNVLDEKIKLPQENSSVGIILCKERNETVVQYSLRNTNNPIGVAKYRISDKIPKEVLTVLPNLNKLKELM